MDPVHFRLEIEALLRVRLRQEGLEDLVEALDAVRRLFALRVVRHHVLRPRRIDEPVVQDGHRFAAHGTDDGGWPAQFTGRIWSS